VRKDRLRRLEKLEAARKAIRERLDIIGIVYRTHPEGTDRVLAADEEWVDDWHVKPDGSICKITMRISADHADHGRNYVHDETGQESEDPSLERESRGRIIWVVRKSEPFAARIGTRVVRYVG